MQGTSGRTDGMSVSGELSGENGQGRDGQRPHRGRGRLFVAAGFVALALGAAAWFVGPVALPEQCFVNGERIPCAELAGRVPNAGGGSGAQENVVPAERSTAGSVTESGFPVSELDGVRGQYDRVASSVVKIGGSSGHGTGWLLDEWHVITNWHVVTELPEEAVPMETREGAMIFGAVIATDEFDDIAIVLLDEPTRLPPLPVAKSAPSDGEPVFFVGHPGALGDWIVGVGTVTPGRYGAFVRSSLPATPGASGSAMLNLAGEVVALISGCIGPPIADSTQTGEGPQIFSSAPKPPDDSCGGTDIVTVMDFIGRILESR